VSLEAIQNAAKHAGTAVMVTVELGEDSGGVTFSIEDDGRGFVADRAARGQGLSNMADRLASVGGELSIESTAGHGTRVVGRVPVTAGSGVRS
jgi:signal transduction histidine kinase